MTTDQLHILLVEDEAILALDLKAKLQHEGYRVVGTAATGQRALELFARERVDLVLCDIHLKGEIDGIETGHRLLAERAVPLIYLTAFSDRATLERASQTGPAAYLIKPANIAQIRIAIDLAISNIARLVTPPPAAPPIGEVSARTDRDLNRDTILRIENQVFVKSNQQFVRINLADVLYLEAEDIYTTLVTPQKKYVLRLSLAQVLERINYVWFVRVHRSYAVNIEQVEAFNEQEITIGPTLIPLGRSYRETFINRFSFR